MFSSLRKHNPQVPNGFLVSFTALRLCQDALQSHINPRGSLSTTFALYVRPMQRIQATELNLAATFLLGIETEVGNVNQNETFLTKVN